MKKFEELGLSDKVIKAISNMGFEELTPIQELTIPFGISGKDLIGQAQTGTGKTAAFGIPLIEKAELDEKRIQGIVLTPTRELAVQVAEELNRIGQFKGIRTLPIYGGQDIGRQIRALKNKPHIIVGTPGRLLDHIRRKTIKLDSIKTIVLDEADEMLNMGFIEDIEAILDEIPVSRQTMLFSATMPERIRKLSQKFMDSPEILKTKAKEVTVPNIEQQYMEVKEKQKFDVLCTLLDIQSPELAIIFGRTKRRVDELSEALSKRGYSADGIHGDLTQAKREQVIRKFKDGRVDVLVATDVAARGLDITGVTHVYNFDVPQDPESYVHRIGRTGRAGKTGLAITFVTPRETEHLHFIEKSTKRKIIRKNIPTLNEAFEGQKKITAEKIVSTIDSGEYSRYKGFAEELLEEYDSVTLIAASLKLLTKETDRTPVELTSEAPQRSKSMKNSKKRDYSGRGNKGGYRDNKKSNKNNRSKSRNYRDQKGKR